jgi:chemotaxis protein methyltransferase CheR
MKDEECVRFLHWALPKLHLRWPGFRKVRRQVCKRIDRRLSDLGLADVGAYQDYLEFFPAEWETLDSFTRITISRFYRDRYVYDFLGKEILPDLARLALSRGDPELRCWSAGCASGEEPYSIGILWVLEASARFTDLPIQIKAIDADENLLSRAREACYSASSLKDVPEEWKRDVFELRGNEFSVKMRFRDGVEFSCQDIRREIPNGPFHLILCRNLAFTYFDEGLQNEVLSRILSVLVPGGVLVIGHREVLPSEGEGLLPQGADLGIYRQPENF